MKADWIEPVLRYFFISFDMDVIRLILTPDPRHLV